MRRARVLAPRRRRLDPGWQRRRRFACARLDLRRRSAACRCRAPRTRRDARRRRRARVGTAPAGSGRAPRARPSPFARRELRGGRPHAVPHDRVVARVEPVVGEEDAVAPRDAARVLDVDVDPRRARRLPERARGLRRSECQAVLSTRRASLTLVMEPLLVRAARREPVERTPVWFMRQAGRSLPEYRAVREQHSFWEVAQHARAVRGGHAAAGPSPRRRCRGDVRGHHDPRSRDGRRTSISSRASARCIETPGPFARRRRSAAAFPSRRTHSRRSSRRSAIVRGRARRRACRRRLLRRPVHGRRLSGRRASRRASFPLVKELMYREPDVWHALMDRLAECFSGYVAAQVRAGADVVQLFDSWVGVLSPADYDEFVAPWSARILASVDVPTIHFGTGTATLLPAMARAGGDVIGLDWRLALDEGWTLVGDDRAVQGNLDPAVLLGPWERIEAAAPRRPRAGSRPAGPHLQSRARRPAAHRRTGRDAARRARARSVTSALVAAMRRPLPRQVAAIAALVLTLLTWQTVSIVAHAGVDPSWRVALHLAHLQGIQYGPDFVWTYGPLGYLAFPLAVSGGTLAAALVCVLLAQTGLGLPPRASKQRRLRWSDGDSRGLRRAPPTDAACGLPDPDRRRPRPLVTRRAGRPTARLFPYAGAVLAAVAVLTKTNMGLAAFGVVVVACAAGGARRVVEAVGTAVLAFVALWVAFGNSLTNIPEWWRLSLSLVAGYSAAMQYEQRGLHHDYLFAAVLVGPLVVCDLGGCARPARAGGGCHRLGGRRCLLRDVQGVFRAPRRDARAGVLRRDGGRPLVPRPGRPRACRCRRPRARDRGVRRLGLRDRRAVDSRASSRRPGRRCGRFEPPFGRRRAFTGRGTAVLRSSCHCPACASRPHGARRPVGGVGDLGVRAPLAAAAGASVVQRVHVDARPPQRVVSCVAAGAGADSPPEPRRARQRARPDARGTRDVPSSSLRLPAGARNDDLAGARPRSPMRCTQASRHGRDRGRARSSPCRRASPTSSSSRASSCTTRSGIACAVSPTSLTTASSRSAAARSPP